MLSVLSVFVLQLIELQKQFDSTMVALPYVHEGTRPLTGNLTLTLMALSTSQVDQG